MTDIDTLSNDIRAVNGKNDLGAGELAEKLVELGWKKIPLDDINTEYDIEPPLTNTQADQVTELISSVLSSTVKLTNEKPLELKDYADGDKVQVVKNGDWQDGFIQNRDSKNGPLHVFTERGPVTVASNKMIRKPVAAE